MKRLALALILASPAVSEPLTSPLGEPHLSIIPRTETEAARIASVTAPARDFTAAERFETHPAGKATKFDIRTRDAFSFPSPNLPFEQELDFKVGNGFFKRLWATAPASTEASDGLGPLFNARACQRCHLKDGRGHTPEGPRDDRTSMFLRLSIPAASSELDPEVLQYLHAAPEPTYGLQMQDKSIAGVPAEGRMEITYSEIEVPLNGGEVASLRMPTYAFTDHGYGAPHPDLMISPRVAPQMIGMGLIEAIPEADILAHADPEDRDGDGISGRAQRVWSPAHQQFMLGRFSHKAGNATVIDQTAGAFEGDIGISTPLHPAGAGECTAAQTACLEQPDGNSPQYENLEVPSDVLDLVTFYSRNLAVPARRDVDDPQVLRGKELFYTARCTACHMPKFVTHRLNDQPAQSFQLIWPYSDFLLHDMGEGLADNRPEWQASGREWRTAPLWGIGMTEAVSGHTQFLHDGRARNLLEAILWHGGEAKTSQQFVIDLSPEDRKALISYLESL